MTDLDHPAPDFSREQAGRLASEHFGLAGELSRLDSERDQNFRLVSDAGEWTLKIVNASEPAVESEFQAALLEHLGAVAPQLALPRLRKAASGAALATVTTAAGARHALRMVSWLPGRPLAESERTSEVLHSLGRMLGRMDRALQGFIHPGALRMLDWDVRRAGQSRARLHHVADAADRALLARFLDRFDADGGAALAGAARAGDPQRRQRLERAGRSGAARRGGGRDRFRRRAAHGPHRRGRRGLRLCDARPGRPDRCCGTHRRRLPCRISAARGRGRPAVRPDRRAAGDQRHALGAAQGADRRQSLSGDQRGAGLAAAPAAGRDEPALRHGDPAPGLRLRRSARRGRDRGLDRPQCQELRADRPPAPGHAGQGAGALWRGGSSHDRRLRRGRADKRPRPGGTPMRPSTASRSASAPGARRAPSIRATCSVRASSRASGASTISASTCSCRPARSSTRRWPPSVKSVEIEEDPLGYGGLVALAARAGRLPALRHPVGASRP